MVQPTYPGVYIREVPSGVRTITGVATSTAAFLGYLSRGPMDEAVRCFSFGDVTRRFGGLRADSEASYAIQQFFLNGGSEAYIVRVAAASDPVPARSVLRDPDGQDVLLLEAAEPGQGGNGLRVAIDHGTPGCNLTVGDGAASETLSGSTLAELVDDVNDDASWTGPRLVTASLVGTPTTLPAQTGTVGAIITADVATLDLTQEVRVFVDGVDQGAFDLDGAAIASVDGLRLRLQQRLRAQSSTLTDATVLNTGGLLRVALGRGSTDGVITFEDVAPGTIVNAIGLDTNAAGKPPPTEGPEMLLLAGGHDGGPAAAATEVADEVGGTPLLRFTAADPGAWGNGLRLDVDHAELPGAPPGTFNLTVSETGVVNGRVEVLRQEVHPNLVIDPSSSRHVADVLNGSDLISVEVLGTPGSGARPAPTGTISGAIGSDPGNIVLPGEIGGTMLATVGGAPLTVTLPPETFETASALASALQRAIRAAKIPRATVEVLGSRATQRHLRIRVGGDDPTAVVAFAADDTDPLAGTLGLDVASRANVQQYSLGSAHAVGAQSPPTEVAFLGHDGDPPKATDLAPDSDDGKEGLYALVDVDLFNILCIPDTMRLTDDEAKSVAERAEAFCEAERAMYILDPPQPSNDPRNEPTEIQEWLDANAELRHPNAVLYWPRGGISDGENERRLRYVATSGTMAGVWARTDGTRGVWKAPAGTDAVLDGVRSLEYQLTDAENGVLNPLGINALRTRPIVGAVSWGARTLHGADQMASEWKYVPVRRTALFIEESLFRGTQWVVFEPNDATLWGQIRLNVTTFMHTLFRQGAFQGTTPDEAYFVKCDAETNPQADIDRGILNVLVGFAPLKPAEFVIISIQQLAGQLEV